MVNYKINRNKRIKKKWRFNKNFIKFIMLFFIIFLYFIFSDNISVDEKTWSVKIIKSKKIIKESFENTYSWAVYKWLPFDIDVDIKDVYLTWATINLFFSNNPDFLLNKPYKSDNFNKIRYWFMLWKVRNRDKVFWLWKNLDSINTLNFKLKDVIEDDELWFKVANLEWATLFVKLVIKWEKIIK